MSLDVMLSKTYPACPHCGREEYTEWVYSSNITHNLGKMAGVAGIYEELWRPEEVGIIKARQLILIIEKGVERLKKNPQEYKRYDSPNGWGIYEHFVEFVENYLKACIDYPDADVSVSR